MYQKVAVILLMLTVSLSCSGCTYKQTKASNEEVKVVVEENTLMKEKVSGINKEVEWLTKELTLATEEKEELKKLLKSQSQEMRNMEAEMVKNKLTRKDINEFSKDETIGPYKISYIHIGENSFSLELEGYYLLQGKLQYEEIDSVSELVLRIDLSTYQPPFINKLSFNDELIKTNNQLAIDGSHNLMDLLVDDDMAELLKEHGMTVPVTLLFDEYSLSYTDNKIVQKGSFKDIVTVGYKNTEQGPKEEVVTKILQYQLQQLVGDDSLTLDLAVMDEFDEDGTKHYIALEDKHSHRLYYLTSNNNKFELVGIFNGSWGYWVDKMSFIKLEDSGSKYLYINTTNDGRMSGFSLMELRDNQLIHIAEMGSPSGRGYAGLYDEDENGIYDGVAVYENDYHTLNVGFKKTYNVVDNKLIEKDYVMTSELPYPTTTEDLIITYLKMKWLEPRGCNEVLTMKESIESNEGITINSLVSFEMSSTAFYSVDIEEVSGFNSEQEAVYKVIIDNSDNGDKDIIKYLVTISKENEELKIKAITAE